MSRGDEWRRKGAARVSLFLSLESKKPDASRGDSIAGLRNLNTASQALYNIYVFMKTVQYESVFFEKVRFYSVIATSEIFEVRVHRAIKPHIQPDYSIGYVYDVLLKIEAEHYKKRSL